MTILHCQVVELVVYIPDEVVRSEICLECQNKLVEVVHSYERKHRVLNLKEVEFKPKV